MASGDGYSYQPDHLNPQRAPLPTAGDHPFEHTEEEYVRPGHTTQQSEWGSYGNALPSYVQSQQRAYQPPGYGNAIDIGGRGIAQDVSATAPRPVTGRATQSFYYTAEMDYSQRLRPHGTGVAIDGTFVTTAQAVGNYMPPQQQTKAYQQPQAQPKQTYHQSPQSHPQYYAQEYAGVSFAGLTRTYRPSCLTPVQTNSIPNNPSPPQVPVPLVRQQSRDRKMAELQRRTNIEQTRRQPVWRTAQGPHNISSLAPTGPSVVPNPKGTYRAKLARSRTSYPNTGTRQEHHRQQPTSADPTASRDCPPEQPPLPAMVKLSSQTAKPSKAGSASQALPVQEYQRQKPSRSPVQPQEQELQEHGRAMQPHGRSVSFDHSASQPQAQRPQQNFCVLILQERSPAIRQDDSAGVQRSSTPRTQEQAKQSEREPQMYLPERKLVSNVAEPQGLALDNPAHGLAKLPILAPRSQLCWEETHGQRLPSPAQHKRSVQPEHQAQSRYHQPQPSSSKTSQGPQPSKQQLIHTTFQQQVSEQPLQSSSHVPRQQVQNQPPKHPQQQCHPQQGPVIHSGFDEAQPQRMGNVRHVHQPQQLPRLAEPLLAGSHPSRPRPWHSQDSAGRPEAAPPEADLAPLMVETEDDSFLRKFHESLLSCLSGSGGLVSQPGTASPEANPAPPMVETEDDSFLRKFHESLLSCLSGSGGLEDLVVPPIGGTEGGPANCTETGGELLKSTRPYLSEDPLFHATVGDQGQHQQSPRANKNPQQESSPSFSTSSQYAPAPLPLSSNGMASGALPSPAGVFQRPDQTDSPAPHLPEQNAINQSRPQPVAPEQPPCVSEVPIPLSNTPQESKLCVMSEANMVAIANSTAEFLARAGHPVAASDIFRFLENNNHYAAMCKYLRSLGCEFDQDVLGRHLLVVVRRCKGTSSAQSADPPVSTTAFFTSETHGEVLDEVVDHPQPTQATYQEGTPNATLESDWRSMVSESARQPSPSHPPAGTFQHPIAFPQTSPQNPLVIEDSPSPPPAFEGSELPEDRHEESLPRATAQSSIAPELGLIQTAASNGTSQTRSERAAGKAVDQTAGQGDATHPEPNTPRAFDPKVPLAELISPSKAMQRTSYDPNSIASQILIAAGRHPVEKPLNDHLVCLIDNLGISPQSDLATLRWDLIDPKPVEQDVNMDGDEDAMALGVNNGSSAKIGSIHQRKRSRKPTNGSSRITLGDVSAETSTIGTTIEPPLSSLANNTTTPRQRGHGKAPQHAPDGSMPASGGPKLTRPQPGNTAMKPGRAAKKRRTADRAPGGSSRPTFKKYKCKWKDCSAELHNYDNLRRHVFKKHKKKNSALDSFPCLWEGCNRPPTEQQLEGVKGRKDKLPEMVWDFQQEEDFMKHVQEHLEAVKNSLGVGPAALPSDQEFSGLTDINYLSDQQGNVITPIAGPAQPGHQFVPPAGFKATRQFNIAHGIDHHDRGGRQTMAYKTTLERVTIMGAGWEGNPAAELMEHDDGSWRTDFTFRTLPAGWPPPPDDPSH